MTSRENWNHLYSIPWTKLKTVTQCITLERKFANSDCRLILADLNLEEGTSRLTAFSAASKVFSIEISDLVSAIEVIQVGPDDVSYPALAVSAGSKIYIYKNLKPFYRYQLPDQSVNEEESKIWENLLKTDVYNVLEAVEELKKLIEKGISLSSHSNDFLRCSTHERFQLLETFSSIQPFRSQSVICCMSSIKKADTNPDDVDHLIVGTEDCTIYVMDLTFFLVIRKIKIPDVPVFISSCGSFRMMSDILVSSRSSYVYLIETNNFTVKTLTRFPVPIIGLFSTVDGIVVGTQDRLLQILNIEGGINWSQKMPADFVTFRGVYLGSSPDWLLVVALRNNQIRLYNKKTTCSVINLNFQTQAVCFGSYGPFNDVLVTVGEGGGLELYHTEKRTLQNLVKYDTWHKNKQTGTPELAKIAKRKFPQERRREADNFRDMHKIFNYENTFMRLRIVKEYVSASSTRNLKISEFESMKVKVLGEFEGIGPDFLLKLEVKNVGSDQEVMDLAILSEVEDSEYELQPRTISVPMVSPGLSYKTEMKVLCLKEIGFEGIIKILLVHKHSQNPLIILNFEVPQNESIDV